MASTANASQLIDRNAKNLTLQLNAKGEALLTYSAKGRTRHVLAWGAINAHDPDATTQQVKLTLDYTGGYGKYFKNDATAQALAKQFRSGASLSPTELGRLRELQTRADTYWKTAFHGGCGHYDGPPLAWLKLACKAPDGTYWAVQEWQRELPDYGVSPSAAQAVWEVRLSHWTGELPELQVQTDWSWHRFDHLFGTFTYLGKPVYGFHAKSSGDPLDSYGRNVYIDTLDSAYGAGWHRENSALTHKGTGVFCYSFNDHIGGHPAGDGSRYRITVIGPGVTPDVEWEGAAPGAFDAAKEQRANDAISALGDSVCHPN